jgi:hypothetical protein
MPFLMRGAMIEYGSDFLGPLPNVVIFQFNPESLSRTIQIPPRPTGGAARETTQAGEPTIEKITLKAQFSAADGMGANNFLARTMGVGPRLAALEKMVNPASKLNARIGAAVDAIGRALGVGGGGGGGGGGNPRQIVPRQKYPRILFLWGPFRVLPVVIESMTITELQYDFMLNPIQADVSIGLAVNAIDNCSDDTVGRGALEYSNLAKDAQAVANLAATIGQIADMIPF